MSASSGEGAAFVWEDEEVFDDILPAHFFMKTF